MIYLDIILLSVAIVILSFAIIQVRKIAESKNAEYHKVLLSAKYGVQGIQTIDVTAILESIGSNTVVHNYHFDPEDKLLPGTEKYLYLTYALAAKEILMEGDNVGEFDTVEWVEGDEAHNNVLVSINDLEEAFRGDTWIEFDYPFQSIKVISDSDYPAIGKPYVFRRGE